VLTVYYRTCYGSTSQLRLVLVAYVAMRASRKLHEDALCGVSGSPVGFFDVTPLGRIINRFSSDLQAVDVQLRASTQMLFMSAFAILGALSAIALASPLALLAAVPLGLLYYRLAAFYRASSRELRRLESTSQVCAFMHMHLHMHM
jgi:ABC-type multidrug transport system fused ATPase/permease subunit